MIRVAFEDPVELGNGQADGGRDRADGGQGATGVQVGCHPGYQDLTGSRPFTTSEHCGDPAKRLAARDSLTPGCGGPAPGIYFDRLGEDSLGRTGAIGEADSGSEDVIYRVSPYPGPSSGGRGCCQQSVQGGQSLLQQLINLLLGKRPEPLTGPLWGGLAALGKDHGDHGYRHVTGGLSLAGRPGSAPSPPGRWKCTFDLEHRYPGLAFGVIEVPAVFQAQVAG